MHENRTELVAAAKGGDKEAMELLIKEELPWVRGIVYGYVGPADVVDDLCQEVFVSVWQSLDKLRSPSNFRTWLYRITINKVRSYLRSHRRATVVTLPEDVPAPASTGAEETSERQELVRAALAKLPPEYRDPLVIYYLQGKSCDETAKTLGLRPGTARIRLLRGRQKLQEVLKKTNGR